MFSQFSFFYVLACLSLSFLRKGLYIVVCSDVPCSLSGSGICCKIYCLQILHQEEKVDAGEEEVEDVV